MINEIKTTETPLLNQQKTQLFLTEHIEKKKDELAEKISHDYQIPKERLLTKKKTIKLKKKDDGCNRLVKLIITENGEDDEIHYIDGYGNIYTINEEQNMGKVVGRAIDNDILYFSGENPNK